MILKAGTEIEPPPHPSCRREGHPERKNKSWDVLQ